MLRSVSKTCYFVIRLSKEKALVLGDVFSTIKNDLWAVGIFANKATIGKTCGDAICQRQNVFHHVLLRVGKTCGVGNPLFK